MSNLSEKVTVIHIVGTGRNGSTLLERILNEVPDFFAVGEVGWTDLEKMEECNCHCGKNFQVCPAWSAIMKEDDFQKIDKKGMAEWRDKYRNSSYIFKSFLDKKQDFSDMFEKYLYNTYLFYHAVQKSSACKYITDSTCSAAYCHNLSLVPEIDLYVIHLVREPKGVAHSRSITKYWPNSKVVWLPRVTPWSAAITWVKRNLFIELAFAKRKDRYLRVHYEDLIENPTQTIKRIGKLLGLELKQLDFIDGKNVVLGDTHLTGGNIYVSAKTGKTVLKLDERWKRDMKWWNVALVSLITWPLMLRYFIVDKIKKHS